MITARRRRSVHAGRNLSRSRRCARDRPRASEQRHLDHRVRRCLAALRRRRRRSARLHARVTSSGGPATRGIPDTPARASLRRISLTCCSAVVFRCSRERVMRRASERRMKFQTEYRSRPLSWGLVEAACRTARGHGLQRKPDGPRTTLHANTVCARSFPPIALATISACRGRGPSIRLRKTVKTSASATTPKSPSSAASEDRRGDEHETVPRLMRRTPRHAAAACGVPESVTALAIRGKSLAHPPHGRWDARIARGAWTNRPDGG